MVFGRNGDDPTARRRRAPDEVLLQAQEVIRRHGQGESVRSIARALGLARTSVARIVAEYAAAQEVVDSGEDPNSEYAALVSKYEAGGGMTGEDARTWEDIKGLDALQFWRMRHLPADHPAQVACAALFETGWTRPPAESLHDSRDDGHSWRAGIAEDW